MITTTQNTSQPYISSQQQQLLEDLKKIPQEWALTPVDGKKKSYRKNWQNEPPVSREAIAEEIKSGRAKGYGLRTGTVSGGLVALDADGHAAHKKILELSSGTLLPETASFTSGKSGRCQYLFYVPQEFWNRISTKKIGTGIKGDDGKEQKLELRWDGCQSVLPPSVHPETGQYHWVKSPQEVAIAQAPMWVIEAMLQDTTEAETPLFNQHSHQLVSERWTDIDWALSYLSALSPYRADDYDEWLAVGMALHSVDDSLLIEWENWSRQSPKYKPGCCDKKWKSFKRSGVAIGTLAHMAKQDGWRSPFSKNYQPIHHTQPSTVRKLKLPLKDAAFQARETLLADLDELSTNIKLEEIREACAMSSYDWERKIVKPLKRDLEGDRFKFELLGLLQIDDPVERIRQQALMAPKYQMSSSLIEKAMGAMKQRTQTAEAQPLDLDGLFDMESQGLNWLIPGLLPRGETVVLAGSPKAGKTLLAIDAAFAVATGESNFLGESTTKGKVLLISVDESAGSTKAKLMNRGFRRGDTGRIKVMLSWDISQLGTLEKTLEDFRPDLVIIDSLRRINKGSEISENSAEFADNIYNLKETLERYGCAGILIHHTNKDREALGVHRLRGSSAIAGAVWGTWQLDQIPKPDPKNKKKLTIDPKDPKRSLSVFARDIEGQTLTIELNPEDSSWHNLGELGDSEEAKTERETIEGKILRVLEANTHLPGLSGKEIIELIEGMFEQRSIYNQLSRMTAKRIISCKPAPGDKRYKIYSLPNCHTGQLSSTNCHTLEFSHTPPSPTPTAPVDEYYPEMITTYGIDNSHQNSHQLVINSHQQKKTGKGNNYSNEEPVNDSEIVITSTTLREGGGEKTPTSVTVDCPELPHSWDESEAMPKAVGFSPITSSTDTLSPAVELAALLRLAECWEEVEAVTQSVDSATKTEAWSLLTNEEQARIRAIKPTSIELAQAEREPIQVGDKVIWDECPGHLSWMNPFVVESIEGSSAKLEYCTVLAPLPELRHSS